MKLGIIGEGHIGATIGPLLKKAGHEILFGARTRRGMGPDGITEASLSDAMSFGDAVICAVPFKAWPVLASELADTVKDKIVIDTSNPDATRDGTLAQEGLNNAGGAGGFVQKLIPTARLVRTFSTVEAGALGRGAHREGDWLGLPVAGDDVAAVELAAMLVRDAGFEPVVVGKLAEARRFDSDTAVFNTGMSGPELAGALKVARDPVLSRQGPPR